MNKIALEYRKLKAITNEEDLRREEPQLHKNLLK